MTVVNTIVKAGILVSLGAGLLAPVVMSAASANAQSTVASTVKVPVDTTIFHKKNQTVLLKQVNVANGEYKLTVVSRNNVSIHPGNNLIVKSGSSSITVKEVESKEFVSKTANGKLVVKDGVVKIYAYIGDKKGTFSGGLDVKLKKIVKKVKRCDVVSDSIVTIDEDKVNPTRHKHTSECADMKVCVLDGKDIKTIKKNDYNTSTMSTDMNKCKTQVCDLDSNAMITIYDQDYNSKKHSRTAADCDDIKVCVTATKTQKTIARNDYDSKTMSKDMNKCKTQVCDLDSNAMITIYDQNYNSKKHSRNAADCEDVEVCVPATKTKKTVARNDYDSKTMTEDMNKCKEVKNLTVCDVESDKVVTIKEDAYNSTKHSKKATDCDKVEVCVVADKSTKKVAKNDYDAKTMTKDMTKCEDEGKGETPAPTPEAPAPVVELPKTGISSTLLVTLGLGLATAGAAYLRGLKR